MAFPPASSLKRAPPAAYNAATYSIIRLSQLLSAGVVAGFTLFFTWHLARDDWALPWTLLVLVIASLLTILQVLSFGILHYCLSALLSSKSQATSDLILTSLLSGLWAAGVGLMSYWSSGTLLHACNATNEPNEDGRLVCRLFKALWVFVVLAFLSTIASLWLLIVARRRLHRLGAYNKMRDLDQKTSDTARLAAVHQESDEWGISGHHVQPFEDEDHSKPLQSRSFRESLGWKDGDSHAHGYEAPLQQTGYDTSYQGGHANI